jgi:hypothetical protein
MIGSGLAAAVSQSSGDREMGFKPSLIAYAPDVFRVGDRIKILLGERWEEGVVVEDRGPLGGGGRRIYRISVPMPPAEPWEAEVPVEWLVAAECSDG